MSIAIASPQFLPILLPLAAGLGLLGLLLAGVLRPPARRTAAPASPLLGVALVAALAAWLLVPMVIGASVPRRERDDEHKPPPAAVIAAIALLAPTAGLAAGLWALKGTPLVRQQIGLTRSPRPADLATGLLAAMVVIPATYAALAASEIGWRWIGYRHPDQHRLLTLLGVDSPAWLWATIGVAAIVMTPLFEELLFRGFLQTMLRRWMPATPAILISSALFASIHENWTAPAMFVFSVGTGALYARTGRLWPAVMLHAAFNALGIARSWAG